MLNLLQSDQAYYGNAIRARGHHYKLAQFQSAKYCVGSLHPWAWWLLLKEIGYLVDTTYIHPQVQLHDIPYPKGLHFAAADDVGGSDDLDLPDEGSVHNDIGADEEVSFADSENDGHGELGGDAGPCSSTPVKASSPGGTARSSLSLSPISDGLQTPPAKRGRTLHEGDVPLV